MFIRKFWMFVGGAYVFINRNIKLITPLLLIALVVAQFSFLIFLSMKISRVEKSLNEEKESSLQILNRVYSQVWLLNSRVNSVLEQKQK